MNYLMNFREFLADIQNAKNVTPFRPEPMIDRASYRIARYIDEREGRIWELIVSYNGHLAVLQGVLLGEEGGMKEIKWSPDTIRIEQK